MIRAIIWIAFAFAIAGPAGLVLLLLFAFLLADR